MKKKILLILTVLVLCLAFSINDGESATYYLDAVNGDDNNSGTSVQPWKTLNRAYTWYSGSGPKVQEGDTVLFRDGSYGGFREHSNDPPTNAHHFHRTNWITYKAAPGHTPSLSRVTINNADHAVQPYGSSWGESYLVFDGFKITNRAVLEYTNYLIFKNCEITQNPATDATSVPITGFDAPYFDYWVAAIDCKAPVNYLTVQDCNIHDTWRGINGYGSHILIHGNTFHHCSSDGIAPAKAAIDVSDIIIEDNLIYDIRQRSGETAIAGTINGTFEAYEPITLVGTNTTGVYLASYSGYILAFCRTQNTFWDYYKGNFGHDWNPNYYILGSKSGATVTNITNVDIPHADGIDHESYYSITGLIVRRNIIDLRKWYSYHGATGQAFKFVTYYPKYIESPVFENNVFNAGYDPPPGYGGCQMYFQGVRNLKFNNNISMGNSNGLFFASRFNNSTVAEMYNNIFELFEVINNGQGYSVNIPDANHGNNIFRSTYIMSGTGFHFSLEPSETVLTTNVALEGLFVNFDAEGNGVSDFRLAPGSLAIAFGDPAHASATDILSYPRDAKPDAGCYEYGANPLKGDINKYGQVNIQDVQACINHILGKQDWGSKADVNGDGKVDEADVHEIVNIILRK